MADAWSAQNRTEFDRVDDVLDYVAQNQQTVYYEVKKIQEHEMGLGVIVYFEICCHDLECQAEECDIKDCPNRRHDERRDQQHLVHGLDLPLFPEVEVAVNHEDVNQLDHFHAKKDTPDQVDFSKRLE